MTALDRSQRGLILKQAREEKNIRLDAVQEATKIPLDSLKAIEEGYRVRTMTDFYYRAFVKIYAKYLGVDISAVLEDYHPQQSAVSSKKESRKTILEERITPLLTPKQVENLIKIVIAFILLLGCVRLVGCWMKSRHAVKSQAQVSPRTEQKKSTPSSSPQQAKSASVATSGVKPANPTPALASQAPSKKKQKIDLTVRPKKTTWISVRVDGVDLSRSTLAKGVAESWQALDSIEITGKNLGDLEFELNGQIQGALGRLNRPIKKIIVNQDGFQVQQ